MSKNEKVQTGYPSIDKPWLKYYDTDFDETKIPEKSIYQLAYEQNKNNLNSVAIDLRTSVTDYAEGIKITYKELFEKTKECAKALISLGINRDEIILIILPNLPEARMIIYGSNMIGAITYPISPLLPINQLKKIISDNCIQTVFLFEPLYEKYKNVLAVKNIIILSDMESKFVINKDTALIKEIADFNENSHMITWNRFLSIGRSIKSAIEPYYEKDHIAVIVGTSGTTGVPKAACITDRNLNAAALSALIGKSFEGSFMDALMPSIGYGMRMLHYETVSGITTYLIPELITTNIAHVLLQIKPDCFPGGPVHYINLLNSNEFKSGIFPKFKNLISGGASLPKEVERKLNNISDDYSENGYNENIIVRQGFGLTENIAMGSYSKHGSYKFGSIGIPELLLTFGIFVPGTDEELKYGEQGELCICGPTVMKEYLNNSEETEKIIMLHRDGKRWIHTKDICTIDEDGNVFHLERIKNIFMRTGFNVHPSKISEYINTIPSVKDSCVIGFEHPAEQCVPVAFVAIDNPDIFENAESEIQAKCCNNLEKTSVPYAYVFVNILPTNLGGKIDIKRIKNESGIDFMKNLNVPLKVIKFLE